MRGGSSAPTFSLIGPPTVPIIHDSPRPYPGHFRDTRPRPKSHLFDFAGVPYRIRTGVAAVRGRCPRPLDEGDRVRLLGRCLDSRWARRDQAPLIPPALPHGADYSRKFTYCSGCSILSPRIRAIASCKSSRFLPVTRNSPPCTAACILSLLSLMSRTSCLASTASMPWRNAIVWRTVLPAAFSGLP